MNDLNKLYAAILLAFNGNIKGDFRIVLKLGKEEVDVRVDDMFVYLPVSEVLDSTNTSDKVFFHPACESITSKETEIFKIVRRMAVIRLLELFKKYPTVLFGVANAKEKRSWNQNTLDTLEPIKGVKRSVIDEVMKLMDRMRVEVEENGNDNRFIHLKVSKGAGRSQSGQGERVYYKTKPVFPIYNEVIRRLSQSEGQGDNQTVDLHGYSVSRAALKVMSHLFQVILPAVIDPDMYTYEATSSVAARLVSYLRCFEGMAEQLNRIQHLFRGDFEKLGIYPIDLNWTEQMDELPSIYNQIPALDYNTHNTQEEQVSQSQATNGMNGMFSVTSSPQQMAVNHQQQINNQQQQVMSGNVAGFVTTPPPMAAGDRYIKSEIDYSNGQILHHAINAMSNVPVIYYCTKSGSFLMRTEQPGMGMGMGGIPGMPIPGMGMNGMINPAMLAMQGMMSPQQLMAMQMGMMPQTATSAGVSSIVHDGGNNGSGHYTF